MKLSIVHILGIIAIFQSLVLSLFFFTNKKGNSLSNRIFGLFLFTFAIIISYSFSNSIDVYKSFTNYSLLFFIVAQTAFLIGPLLYFYIKSLLVNNFGFTKKDSLHLVPYLVAVILFPTIRLAMKGNSGWNIPLNTIFNASLLLVESIYIILSYRLLRTNNIRVKSFFSFGGNKQFPGIKFLIVGFIFIWNIKLQSFLLLNIGEKFQFCPYTESLYFLVMFLFLNALIFILLKNPDFFTNLRKYKSSELSDEEKEKIKNKLISYIQEEKPYLEPTLTLPALSEKLSVNSRYLSQIINESFNKNFNDFINEYRVRESEKLLGENSGTKKTMLEIAYYSGFNSKSSFYDAFKKYTGVTPKEFKSVSAKEIEISLN